MRDESRVWSSNTNSFPVFLQLYSRVFSAVCKAPYFPRTFLYLGLHLSTQHLDPPSGSALVQHTIALVSHNHGDSSSTLRGGGRDPSVMWPWHRPPPWRSPQRTSPPAAARGAAPRVRLRLRLRAGARARARARAGARARARARAS